MTRPRRGPPREGGGRREAFERCRSLLFSVAYRMLGSAVDAEDVVQEAYLRWRALPDGGEEVRSPRDYLAAVAVRLCLDRLRSAKRRREEYVGPWLPEPLLTEQSLADPSPDPSEGLVLDESLSMAFLVLLESLTPTERAVFLMRDVFGYDYAEVSHLVGKSEANCRQIARRARGFVASRRPRFEDSAKRRERLTQRFIEACRDGDADALLGLLAEDVALWTDGGGRAPTALNPIHGADRVVRFLLAISREATADAAVRPARINGEPGVVTYDEDGRPTSTTSIEAANGRVRAVRIVVNPEKLGAIPPLP